MQIHARLREEIFPFSQCQDCFRFHCHHKRFFFAIRDKTSSIATSLWLSSCIAKHHRKRRLVREYNNAAVLVWTPQLFASFTTVILCHVLCLCWEMGCKFMLSTLWKQHHGCPTAGSGSILVALFCYFPEGSSTASTIRKILVTLDEESLLRNHYDGMRFHTFQCCGGR